jgi:hypothetical protein
MASVISRGAARLYNELLKKAQIHTSDLRLKALEAGWPPELAMSLKIRVTPEGEYKDWHPKSLDDMYFVHEHGNGEDLDPNPVVRNFMTSIGGGQR